MDKPTPRINSQLREKYVDQTVRLIGKYKGDTAVLQATDGGQVLVKLNGETPWASEYVEVIGRLDRDFSLMEFRTTNLGNSLDLDLANKVVEYGQKFPELFELSS